MGSFRPVAATGSLIVWSMLLAGGLALALACGGPPPLAERSEGSGWAPLAAEVITLSGQRDGTRVVFHLELGGEVRLVVEGELHVDPQPRLVEGVWREAGSAGARRGTLSALSLDFLGGQGGRPSLGGRFLLLTPAGPAYRLNLPAIPLDAPR